jgi:Glycosyl hydrolases family 2/Exo-beta-D-glucosaminidase Ig-fold domain
MFAISATSASADVSTLSGQWNLVPSSVLPVSTTGAQISTPGFSTTGWLPVITDSGGSPGTEVYALEQNGDQSITNVNGQITPVPNAECSNSDSLLPDGTNAGLANLAADPTNGVQLQPNVYYSANMATCWGDNPNSGEGDGGTIPTNSLFAVPWWYQTNFTDASFTPGQNVTLIVNGIVGQADIWVNGTEVASQTQTEGDYAKFTFNVTPEMVAGTNSVAFEVYPNNPYVMFTVDNVDWTQNPVDNNTGIQFPVQIQESNTFQLSNAHVVENNAANMSQSALTVKGDVTNNTTTQETGTVSATITEPDGDTLTTVTQNVTVDPNSTDTVVFSPDDYPSLLINNPQVWWPYQMGSQPLYGLSESVSSNDAVNDTASETFGIRTVSSYLTAPSALATTGLRQYAINGVPFVFRGGGWLEELDLHYSAEDIANQIALIKNLGLNGIRTEGKQMPDQWYEQMDKAGILIDAGFQCCDNSWERSNDGASVGQSSSNYTSTDYQNIYNAALGIGENLRNHPSVLGFEWSDSPPTKEQEALSLDAWSQADFDVPFVALTDNSSSPILGPAGEHEGVYDYGAPSDWYSVASNGDGAESVGFDSESSSGDTIPTLDSLNRFLSPADQASLWQTTSPLISGQLTQATNPCYWGVNQYHLNWESSCPQGENYNFGTMENFDVGLYNRYGTWTPYTANPSGTGVVTTGSSTVTGVTSNGTNVFTVGKPISGAGIPSGTSIGSVTNSTVTLAITSGSTSATASSITGTFLQGDQLFSTSAGIPGGTTIVSCPGGSTGSCGTGTWTLSNAATATASRATSSANTFALENSTGPVDATASSAATGETVTGPTPAPLAGGAIDAPGLNQYVEEGQLQTYESNRAQFESVIDHSTNYPNPATGTDYWMLNHADPTLYWSLYNFDYDQPGGYFGAKKANETLHALYAYDNSATFDNDTVAVDNLGGTTQSNISVTANVYTINSDGTLNEMSSQTATGVTLPAQGVQNEVITETPGTTIPASTTPPQLATTYFVELVLSQGGTPIDHNVYWVSTQQDTSTGGSPAPTFSSPQAYGNLSELDQLPSTTISAVASTESQADSNGDDSVAKLTLTNTGNTVAFFMRADLRSGTSGGTELSGDSYAPGTEQSGDSEVKPVEYSDDDITLFPGETETITASYRAASLAGAAPVFSLYGFNVPQIVVLAGSGSTANQNQIQTASQPGSLGTGSGSIATVVQPAAKQTNTRSAMKKLKKKVSVVTTHVKWLHGHRQARIILRCKGAASCKSTVTVTARERIKKKTRTVVIGRKRSSIAANKSRTIRFTVKRSIETHLERHPNLVARTTAQG